MSPLFFEDFEIGREYVTRSRTVTEADVVAFAGLSGDFNPLHTDEEFGKRTLYGSRIAHGLLVLSMASGLMTQTGITEGTVLAFLGLNWNFRDAVRFGDTVSVRMKVTGKRETKKADRGIVNLALSVLNQREELVQEGEFTLMILRRPV
jgi:acyl dehydratase